jgi:hypothetical protein
MPYSKAYQEVIAGRVRETEQIGFFRENKVATPARVTSFQSTGGRKLPSGEVDHLRHPGVGKRGTVSDVIDMYLPNAYNLT